MKSAKKQLIIVFLVLGISIFVALISFMAILYGKRLQLINVIKKDPARNERVSIMPKDLKIEQTTDIRLQDYKLGFANISIPLSQNPKIYCKGKLEAIFIDCQDYGIIVLFPSKIKIINEKDNDRLKESGKKVDFYNHNKIRTKLDIEMYMERTNLPSLWEMLTMNSDSFEYFIVNATSKSMQREGFGGVYFYKTKSTKGIIKIGMLEGYLISDDNKMIPAWKGGGKEQCSYVFITNQTQTIGTRLLFAIEAKSNKKVLEVLPRLLNGFKFNIDDVKSIEEVSGLIQKAGINRAE